MTNPIPLYNVRPIDLLPRGQAVSATWTTFWRDAAGSVTGVFGAAGGGAGGVEGTHRLGGRRGACIFGGV